MKTRIITAVIALAVFVGLLLAPPVVFTIALAAVTVIMLLECYKATKADAAMKVVGLVSAVLLMFIMHCITYPYDMAFIAAFVIGIIIVLLMYMILVVKEHDKKDYKSVLSNGFLTLYITISMWCIIFTKQFFGTKIMLLIFICAWTTDTFAYFSGRLFGKNKLIPHVSPNKTVEGAIGGVLGAMLSCLIYLFVLSIIPDFNVRFSGFNVMRMIAAGLLGGVFSQLGDLVASSIKRDTGIKDFGWIFPGHGGFMDRFDSVMFISMIFFAVLEMGAWIELL